MPAHRKSIGDAVAHRHAGRVGGGPAAVGRGVVPHRGGGVTGGRGGVPHRGGAGTGFNERSLRHPRALQPPLPNCVHSDTEFTHLHAGPFWKS